MTELSIDLASHSRDAVADSGPGSLADPTLIAILEHGLTHGGVTPVQAWALARAGLAALVDVRTAEERKFVGHVPGSLHVPWATGTAMTRNPRFVRELEAKVGKRDPVLLLCRSGKRSLLAADAARKGGFHQVLNVLEGFEGDLDEHQQRGRRNGWRAHRLPWIQD